MANEIVAINNIKKLLQRIEKFQFNLLISSNNYRHGQIFN